MTSPSWAPGPPASPPRSTPLPKGSRSLVLDCRAFGGQAGASARIENYLGFPTGITRHGADGARLQSGAEVRRRDGDPLTRRRSGCRAGVGRYVLHLEGDERVSARSVVLASGARYRRLEVDNLRRVRGRERALLGFAARGKLCAGQEVALVGAGNSAGQARSTSPARRRRSGCSRAAAVSRRPCRAISSTASQRSPTSRC